MTSEGGKLGMPAVVWHEDCLLHSRPARCGSALREEAPRCPSGRR